MRIFFDVNVILDIAIRKEQNLDIFDPILIAIQDGKIQGFVTTGVIQTASYFLLKYVKYQKTKEVLASPLPFFHFLEGRKVHVKNALELGWADIEDAIFFQIALDHEMSSIVTNDKDFLKFSQSHMPIITPTELISFLQ